MCVFDVAAPAAAAVVHTWFKSDCVGLNAHLNCLID
jgi:hypothetical protein